MQSHQTCQGRVEMRFYILCMKRGRRSVDGCFPASHMSPLLSKSLSTKTFSFTEVGWGGDDMFFSSSVGFFACVSHSRSSLFVLAVCLCRIWWMISARSSSWKWATWTEARSTAAEGEGACLLGAVASPQLELTGADKDAYTYRHAQARDEI